MFGVAGGYDHFQWIDDALCGRVSSVELG